MRPLAALITALLLLGGSIALVSTADRASDLAAVIGGTGIVLASALLALTVLVLGWTRGPAAYTSTSVDTSDLYAELDAADWDASGADDAISAVG